MACILSLARFPDQSCRPIKLELVYASSPFHININGPSSNYIANLPLVRVRAKKQRANNRLTMAAFSSITSLPQQAEKDEDDSKQTLIERIGEYLDSLVPGGGLQVESLDEALGIVDLIQRLGIQRFFQQQIHRILESLYSKWDEKYGLTHANLTALGFHLLRLNGYDVTADVFKALRCKDGEISNFLIENSAKECTLLNLYKCFQIGFPQESEIMDELEDFSIAQLAKLLSFPQLDSKKREEIEFSLTYPRRYMLARIEAKSIVRGSWYSGDMERKCIQLASIDLDLLQKIYQQEMIECQRWFDKQGFENLQFPRMGVLNMYFAPAMSMFEPQFSLYRLTFCKSFLLILMIDELHDNSTFHTGLDSFQEAFQRWDVSPVENHHPHKAVIKSLHQSLTEFAALASKAQGRDLFPYFKATWDEAIAAYNKDFKWNTSNYFPTFNEYLPFGMITMGAFASLSSITLLPTDPQITENATKLIDKDSRLLHVASLIGRLANDIVTYERETNDGQMIHAISCYMKDNECTEEEAVEAMKKMSKDAFRQLELEIFKCRGIVPEPCIRAVLCFVQHFSLLYRKVDGYRFTTDDAYRQLLNDYFGFDFGC